MLNVLSVCTSFGKKKVCFFFLRKKVVSFCISYQQHNMAFHKGRLGGGQIQTLERNGQPPQHQLIHPQGLHQGTEPSQSFSEPAHVEALVLSSTAFLLPSCRSSELGLTD